MTDDYMEFTRYLARKGKKPHVIEGLVNRVKLFGEFILPVRLEDAGKEQILSWAKALENDIPALKQNMRGIALYYKFMRKDEIASLAGKVRELEISKTRKDMRIRDIMGVDMGYADALENAGIKTTVELCHAGRTPKSRKMLAMKTEIPGEVILEYVNISDMSRIFAVKNIRARLYHDAGLDLHKLADANPKELHAYLRKWVENNGFEGIAPLLKELESTVKEARKLEKIVEY